MFVELITAVSGGNWTTLPSLPMGMQQGPGPDSPFGDVLGWIIVFFVIVWPILRGILESAKGQRKEFDEKQAKAAPPSPRKARQRRTLEEILEGKLQRMDGDVSSQPLKTKPAPIPPTIKGPKPVARFGERPAGEGSAPVYAADDLYRSDRSEDLVGDPFDEETMERDLVPDAQLRHIPSEDEVEAGNATSGTQARGETASTVKARPRVAATRPGTPQAQLVRDDPEVLFRRLARPLTPWQKAVVLREVLRPPLSSRPSPTLTDLPD